MSLSVALGEQADGSDRTGGQFGEPFAADTAGGSSVTVESVKMADTGNGAPGFFEHLKDGAGRMAEFAAFVLRPGMTEPRPAQSDHFRTLEEQAAAEAAAAADYQSGDIYSFPADVYGAD